MPAWLMSRVKEVMKGKKEGYLQKMENCKNESKHRVLKFVHKLSEVKGKQQSGQGCKWHQTILCGKNQSKM